MSSSLTEAAAANTKSMLQQTATRAHRESLRPHRPEDAGAALGSTIQSRLHVDEGAPPRCLDRADKLTVVQGSQAPVESLTDDDLESSVASILAKGLPTTIKAAGQLLGLRSVFARASVPQDQRSRLEALNRLLPRLIGTISDPVYRDAVQTLFGLAPGTRGTTLTRGADRRPASSTTAPLTSARRSRTNLCARWRS